MIYYCQDEIFSIKAIFIFILAIFIFIGIIDKLV